MRGRLASLTLALLALPFGANAAPIEITDASRTYSAAVACSTWVAPSGAEYEWTTICGGQADGDGDGDVDYRVAYIDKAICDGDDPSQAAACAGGSHPFDATPSADEFTFGSDLSGAGLHISRQECNLDLDWTAYGDRSTTLYDDFPPAITPNLAPPSLSLELSATYSAVTYRNATMTGSACPLAAVTGAPKLSYVAQGSGTDRSKTITIDPTA